MSERRVCRGHVVHLGEPKQLHRSFVIGEVLCNVIFSRHFADDTGVMHVSVFFHFADGMGICFWGNVRQLPCHLQVIYVDIYIYSILYVVKLPFV